MSDQKPKRSKIRIAIYAVLGLVLVAAIGIQFKPVNRSNPPVTMVVDAPPEVLAILKRSCFDCHSNETVWPWYSRVAPMSWKVADHVRVGRKHLNFSTWDQYDAEDRADIFEETWEEVEKGEMPLLDYLRLHPEAKLSEADLAVLRAWTGGGESEMPVGDAHTDDVHDH